MEYGKFSSAEELMKGYTELEKSFTQKCQQLSALQKQLNETGGTSEISPPREVYARQTVANVNVDTVPSEGADSPSADGVTARNDDVLNRIRQYLDERGIAPDSLSDKEKNVVPPKVMTEGGNVSMALPSRPRTIKEASEMAKELFK